MPLPVPRRKAQCVRRYYDLPSLTALASFEAAARHLSVKAAAEELNVTPGAVSRQIKALEAELGLALFTRLHRGLALTREGEELAGVLARGFGQVALLLRDFRGRSQGRNVTLGSSNAFASLWLMPRLGAFWRAHPEITVNHMISDRAADLRVPEVELRIRYGGGAWAGEEAERLFGDRILPVAGPEFARKHAEMTLEGLAELPLLHMRSENVEWTSWAEWFRRLHLRPPPLSGQVFTNYSVMLQAAEEGQGVALGWERLVAPMIQAGRLCPVSQAHIDAPDHHYLTWDDSRPLSEEAEVLKDWLLARARES